MIQSEVTGIHFGGDIKWAGLPQIFFRAFKTAIIADFSAIKSHCAELILSHFNLFILV